MTRLTRRYPFSASHRLHSDLLSSEENAELFGKCNNPYGHGHNYVLEVSVEGPVDATSGMLLPRPRLFFVFRRPEPRIAEVFQHTFADQVGLPDGVAIGTDRTRRHDGVIRVGVHIHAPVEDLLAQPRLAA